MGRELMKLELFKKSIQLSDTYLKPHGVQVYNTIMGGDEKAFDNVTLAFIGIIAIQIAMVDVLACMGVRPDGLLGHSVGELGCAYADGAMTAKETLLTAYWRGRCIEEKQLAPGAMAVVGLTWDEAQLQSPENVVPACHNSEKLVTVSGNREAVERFVKDVSDKGIFCREVQSVGVAFHSPDMNQVAPMFKAKIEKVIVPKPRSPRWISTSIPKSEWGSELAKYSCADYHANNLVSPVLFHEALQTIPRNAIVIEISPHCLLHSILKRSMGPESLCVGLVDKKHGVTVEFFLTSLGKCYMAGMNFGPECHGPSKIYPVSKGTPMISPLLKWDHSRSWNIPKWDSYRDRNQEQNNMEFEVNLSPTSQFQYLKDHIIDGHALVPVAAHLIFAWQTLAKMTGQKYETMPVVWQDVQIHRPTFLPASGSIKFAVRIMDGSGHFEICESGYLVLSGRIFETEDGMEEHFKASVTTDDIKYEMSADDIYRELRIRGYDYAFDFKGILKSNITCDRGEVLWTGNWVTHLDTMLQMYILSFQDSLLRLPTRIKYLSIHPQKHRNKMYKIADGNIALDVAVNSKTKTVTAGGLVILGPHATVAERRSLTGSTIQAYHFVPCINKNDVDMSDSLVRYTNLCSVHAVKALQVCCKENGRINDIDHLCSDLDRLTTDTSTFSDVGTLFEQKNFGLFHTIRTFEKGDQCMQSHDDDLLQRDILLTSLHQAETLKPILDIVVDNIAPDSIRALELEASISCMHSKVKDLLSLRSKFAVDYMSADTSLQNMNLAELEASGVETLEWKPTLLAPQYLRKMQLVLAINVLHKYDDLSKVMKNISTVMANGAFFLVQEVTRNFHIHLPVQLMSTDTSAMPLNNNRTWAMYNDEQKWQDLFEQENFEVISKKSDGLLSTLFLLRIRNCSSPSDQTILTIDNFDYDWVDLLKENMQRIQNQPDDSKLWLVVENTVNSGIVGLINCLRYETGGDKLRCIFNASLKTGEDFHLVQDSQVFQTLVKKDLTMNVYRDGSFGYFCHIPPSSSAGKQIPCKHAFVNLSRKGDLSSLRWFESPLKYYTEDTRSDMELCSVHYASLNFRDVMLATGKLPADALPRNLETRECILGMEFSGLDQSGRKVAGIVEAQALASTVLLENRFLVEVPDHWSMEEAATVPLAYATAYYSLVVRGHIRKEDTVLIHAGSGAVGQAAIAVALIYGCEIFTTVGSTEKREYLLTLFPQLTNDHIGNSRESKFEAEILNLTDGRGVDVVLNSLADDKLEASLRVLADHGRFLEIGKYDLSKNTPLGMAIFLKNISFHGILLDALFGENGRDWETVSTLLRKGIQSGVVKPLKHTIFRKYDLESAFRFMARGLHIGKVLIQVIEDIDASGHALDSEILAFPKIYFSVRKSYIITGGLGGFGLEFAQWMLSRGARNLVLTSRSGVKTGYQARKLNKLRAHGATIEVSLRNISDTEDTKHLLEDASELGPVGGIFHMAGVLDIALLKNQSAAQYQKVCDPKIKGVLNLDHECRKQSVEAFDWFVVFSSYVASHGNAGQSNYGFANSAMERICEKRRSDGLAGLAIQWGAIGDVGMAVANSGSNNFEIAGTLPQRICSCISELDQLLNQPQPVIACYVKTDVSTKLAEKSIKRDIVETVLKIIGVADQSSINPRTQFGDLGLDSLLGIELQQVLDADFGLVLSLREFRHLTPQGLEELANPKDKSHDDNQ